MTMYVRPLIDPLPWYPFFQSGNSGFCRAAPDWLPWSRVRSPGHCGGAMMPTYGKKNGRRYHYYLCCKDSKRADAQCPIHQLPAGEIEEVVKSQLKVIMTHPSVLTALSDSAGISCTDILQIFESDFWAEISAGEYKRLVQLLIARVVVLQDHIEIEMKTEGIKSLIGEFCNAWYHSSWKW